MKKHLYTFLFGILFFGFGLSFVGFLGGCGSSGERAQEPSHVHKATGRDEQAIDHRMQTLQRNVQERGSAQGGESWIGAEAQDA